MGRRFTAALIMTFMTGQAFAHHAMEGRLPGTALDGLLSGLGHPVIGLDHLAALIAVGCIASLLPRGALIAAAFVLAAIAGVVLHLQDVTLPQAEMLVAATVIVLGLAAALRIRASTPAAILLVLAGLVHGYALGESIVGAEPAPLYAYLAGLAVIQSALAAGATFAFRTLTAHGRPAAAPTAGVLVAAFGLLALLWPFAA